MMDLINRAASLLNECLNYLHDNALALFIGVAILYSLRGRFLTAASSGATLVSKRGTSSSSSEEEKFQDMLRVREKQQEEARKRSLEAAKLRKIKEAEEKERKNETAKPGAGRKSGKATKQSKGNTTGSGGGGYNPLQPWSASSGGGGYKAQRRTVRRG